MKILSLVLYVCEVESPCSFPITCLTQPREVVAHVFSIIVEATELESPSSGSCLDILLIVCVSGGGGGCCLLVI